MLAGRPFAKPCSERRRDFWSRPPADAPALPGQGSPSCSIRPLGPQGTCRPRQMAKRHFRKHAGCSRPRSRTAPRTSRRGCGHRPARSGAACEPPASPRRVAALGRSDIAFRLPLPETGGNPVSGASYRAILEWRSLQRHIAPRAGTQSGMRRSAARRFSRQSPRTSRPAGTPLCRFHGAGSLEHHSMRRLPASSHLTPACASGNAASTTRNVRTRAGRLQPMRRPSPAGSRPPAGTQ